MLTDLHTTLQRLLFERGNIPPEDVDVRFDMPTKEWVASLIRPTVSMYLFDIQENIELRQTNLETMVANGRAFQRMPPRRFDLRFMISAISSNIEDEHMLLWRSLATLLKYAVLPSEVLAEPLRELQPALSTQISQTDDDTKLLDIWSALELPPRPALLYVVTAPLDLEFEFEAPLVLTRTLRFTRSTPAGEAAARGIEPARITSRGPDGTPRNGVVLVEQSIEIGGVVRDAQGTPLENVTVSVEGSAAADQATDREGRFRLRSLLPGPVRLRITRANQAPKLVSFEVPSDSYDITLD